MSIPVRARDQGRHWVVEVVDTVPKGFKPLRGNVWSERTRSRIGQRGILVNVGHMDDVYWVRFGDSDMAFNRKCLNLVQCEEGSGSGILASRVKMDDGRYIVRCKFEKDEDGCVYSLPKILSLR